MLATLGCVAATVRGAKIPVVAVTQNPATLPARAFVTHGAKQVIVAGRSIGLVLGPATVGAFDAHGTLADTDHLGTVPGLALADSRLAPVQYGAIQAVIADSVIRVNLVHALVVLAAILGAGVAVVTLGVLAAVSAVGIVGIDAAVAVVVQGVGAAVSLVESFGAGNRFQEVIAGLVSFVALVPGTRVVVRAQNRDTGAYTGPAGIIRGAIQPVVAGAAFVGRPVPAFTVRFVAGAFGTRTVEDGAVFFPAATTPLLTGIFRGAGIVVVTIQAVGEISVLAAGVQTKIGAAGIAVVTVFVGLAGNPGVPTLRTADGTSVRVRNALISLGARPVIGVTLLATEAHAGIVAGRQYIQSKATEQETCGQSAWTPGKVG